MKNQCDGCQANRPLVRLIGGDWYVSTDEKANTHIMGAHFINDDGSVTIMGYADLLSCTRELYTDKNR